MKKSTQEKLQEHFTKIRYILGDCRARVLQEIADVAEKDAEASKKYNSNYLAERRTDLRGTSAGRIAKVKETAKQKISQEVAALNIDMKSWLFEPIPQDFAVIVQNFRDFDITPSKAELSVLADQVGGSYLAEKVLQAYAAQVGIDTGFTPLEELQKGIAEMKSDALTAVDAFAGVQDSHHHYMCDSLELPICPEELKYFRHFAERYGKDDNTDDSISRCEKVFLDATSQDIGLTPGKKSELDALFSDCQNEDEKVSIAIRIIEDGGTLADILPMYDKALSTAALYRIADDKRMSAERAVHSMVAMKKAASAAVQASTDAAEAARHAQGDYSL